MSLDDFAMHDGRYTSNSQGNLLQEGFAALDRNRPADPDFTARRWPPLALSIGLRARPTPAFATCAAPSRSAANSEPRGSLAGRDIPPRETEYRAIPKTCTEARHATERAAPTIFCNRRTAYAPNICRPSRAVHTCRRLPSSQ
jgi:hypothetical protein